MEAYADSDFELKDIMLLVLKAIENDIHGLDKSMFFTLFCLESQTGNLLFFRGMKNDLFQLSGNNKVLGLADKDDSLSLAEKLRNPGAYIQTATIEKKSFLILIIEKRFLPQRITNNYILPLLPIRDRQISLINNCIYTKRLLILSLRYNSYYELDLSS